MASSRTVGERPFLAGISLALVGLWGCPALADTAMLNPVRDNTLFGDPTRSNGAGTYVAAGRTNQTMPNALRRAVVAFDVSSIPPGSAITDVTLCLNLITAGNLNDYSLSLHRLQQSWGEGTSNTSQGAGTAATTSDATWHHTFFPTLTWNADGGDFEPAASATTTVGTASGCSNWTGPGLIQDVQEWLDDPASNYGWILIGDESAAQSAKQFASRENTTIPVPLLTVTYTVAGAGAVPEHEGEGASLRVDNDGGGNLALTWGASCRASDTSYAVYEGSIDGTFESHLAISCDTAGATSATVAIPLDSTYYLIVPRNGAREGSYGTRNLGGGLEERPPSIAGCLPQAVAACPP